MSAMAMLRVVALMASSSTPWLVEVRGVRVRIVAGKHLHRAHANSSQSNIDVELVEDAVDTGTRESNLRSDVLNVQLPGCELARTLNFGLTKDGQDMLAWDCLRCRAGYLEVTKNAAHADSKGPREHVIHACEWRPCGELCNTCTQQKKFFWSGVSFSQKCRSCVPQPYGTSSLVDTNVMAVKDGKRVRIKRMCVPVSPFDDRDDLNDSRKENTAAAELPGDLEHYASVSTRLPESGVDRTRNVESGQLPSKKADSVRKGEAATVVQVMISSLKPKQAESGQLHQLSLIQFAGVVVRLATKEFLATNADPSWGIVQKGTRFLDDVIKPVVDAVPSEDLSGIGQVLAQSEMIANIRGALELCTRVAFESMGGSEEEEARMLRAVKGCDSIDNMLYRLQQAFCSKLGCQVRNTTDYPVLREAPRRALDVLAMFGLHP